LVIIVGLFGCIDFFCFYWTNACKMLNSKCFVMVGYSKFVVFSSYFLQLGVNISGIQMIWDFKIH